VVDIQGFLLKVAITAANAHDSHGLKALFDPFPPGLARLRGVLADGAYQGFRTWLWLFATVWLTVVKRPDVKGFVVTPSAGWLSVPLLGWGVPVAFPKTTNSCRPPVVLSFSSPCPLSCSTVYPNLDLSVHPLSLAAILLICPLPEIGMGIR
jgi:hypothetical protein